MRTSLAHGSGTTGAAVRQYTGTLLRLQFRELNSHGSGTYSFGFSPVFCYGTARPCSGACMCVAGRVIVHGDLVFQEASNAYLRRSSPPRSSCSRLSSSCRTLGTRTHNQRQKKKSLLVRASVAAGDESVVGCAGLASYCDVTTTPPRRVLRGSLKYAQLAAGHRSTRGQQHAT